MVKQISLGQLDLIPENGYYVSKVDSVGFATKYGRGTVLKMHGAVLDKPFLLNKVINLELTIIGDTEADVISKRNILIQELKFGEGDNKINLKFTLADNSVVFVEVVLKSFDEGFEAGILNASKVRLSFETESAFFKSEQIYQIDIPITKGGGGAIPSAIPFDMSQGSSGYTSVSVGGNAISYPEIYFYGQLTNPVLRNTTTDQELSFPSTTINTGEYMYVDSENRIVLDHLGVNKRDVMSGDFIYLVVGENKFTLQTDGVGETGYVRLIFRNFYKAL